MPQQHGVTGRLRVGREGFNATLTGPHDGVRAFTAALRAFDPRTFGQVSSTSHCITPLHTRLCGRPAELDDPPDHLHQTDFKYVDKQPDNQLLKGLKVFPVREIVTYGFDPKDAPLNMRGTHLTPEVPTLCSP